MSLAVPHRDFLHTQAITDDVIARYNIRSVTTPDDVPEEIDRYFVTGTGILFDWQTGERVVPQYRPDKPVVDDKGNARKYVFPTGCGTFIGRLREPQTDDSPYLLIEGTKQMFAAASWAPPAWGIRGIAGCNNWVGADLSWVEDRDVVVLFDSDIKTNRAVYDAAVELKEALEGMGAASVTFATLTNARSKEGLDDVLGRLPQAGRTKYLERMVKAAKPSLGRAPKSRKAEHPLFEGGEFLANKASEAVLDGQPAALGLGSSIALYRDGAFRLDFGREPMLEALQRLLGDKYRPSWRTAVEESLIGILSGRGARLPERQKEPLLNCANGMLDLRTMELLPHSPDFLSSLQIPIAWDPSATSDFYGEWVTEHCPDQVEDLEESVATMLDPSRTPSKAVFLFGVSRSGKSTFLNLIQGIAGSRNTSGVDLHQLSEDKFAAANLYGMMLNACADLSAEHVRDTSLFKRVTGDDVVQANRKYGQQFAFTNKALFAFSANTLPTVSETSRAYVERIKPFHFPKTFAGREDPRIGERLRSELPGILVRWVSAWQRLNARGRYAVTDPRVMREFETKSNRVALWMSREARVHPGAPGRLVGADEGTGKQDLYDAFRQWLEREGGAGAMKRSAFLESLESVPGVGVVRLRHRNKNEGLSVTLRPEGERDQPDTPVQLVAKEEPEGVGGVGSVPFEASSPYVSLSMLNDMDGWVGEEREVYGEDAPKPTLPTPPTPLVESEEDHPATGRVVGFDIETPGAEHLLSWDGQEGPWARLCGYSIDGGAPTTTTDVEELLSALYAADTIVAHNGLNYDLIGLARHHGADYTTLAAKCEDLLVTARQIDPPSARHGDAANHYDLDTLGARYANTGKSGDLTALKTEFKGFHLIPVDDPRYRAYLTQDVQLLNDLRPFFPMSEYVKDERDFLAACGAMTLRGVEIDVPLVTERAAREEEQKWNALRELNETDGLPLEKVEEKVVVTRRATGKRVGRKVEKEAVLLGEVDNPDDYLIERTEIRTPSKSPLATKEGIAWLEGVWDRALKDGSRSRVVPRTATIDPETGLGRLSMKGSLLQEVIDGDGVRPPCPEDLARVLNLINTANGARVVYATVLKNMIEGRYHPRMSPEQASGRLSCGISVFGKHGGKVEERAVFVAGEGRRMVAFDFDQVDARAIAAHCQDPAYMDLFEGDHDFHTANAIMVFGDAKYRQVAKVVGHGENYGMGLAKLTLAIMKATNAPLEEAREHARNYMDAVQRAYPVRNVWRDGVRERAARGELLDNGFGRMMKPDAERAWTSGPALIGQGTTRDIMRKSILDLHPEVRDCLQFTVHDELVFSFPEDRVEEYSADVMRAMTFEWFPHFLPSNSRPVHITCGMSKPGNNWSECYS